MLRIINVLICAVLALGVGGMVAFASTPGWGAFVGATLALLAWRGRHRRPVAGGGLP